MLQCIRGLGDRSISDSDTEVTGGFGCELTDMSLPCNVALVRLEQSSWKSREYVQLRQASQGKTARKADKELQWEMGTRE